MKKNTLTASTMAWILSSLIVLLIVGIAFASWQLKSFLTTEMTTTNTIKQKASQSNNDLAQAELLENNLKLHTLQIDRAATVVAESKTYQYQDQIINDITHYASSAGLTILGFNFPTATTAKQSASGLKSINVEVMLLSPMDYTGFLKFVKLIEQNLTKMQIVTIGVSPDKDTPGLINSPSIGLEVYIK